MSACLPIVSPVTRVQVNSDLDVIEHDLFEEEEIVSTRLAQARQHGENIRARLRTLGTVVLRGPALSQSQAYRSLRTRVDEAVVPSLDTGAIEALRDEARWTALRARQEALAALTHVVADYVGQLARMAAQLAADEQTVASLRDSSNGDLPPPIPLYENAGARAAAEASPNKRACRRVQLETAVDMGSESNFFTGFTTDISAGGLFVATNDAVGVGMRIDLLFSLPGGRRIKAQGEVRWVRPYDEHHPEVAAGAGVQFVDLAEEARQAIEHFVSSRDPIFYSE
jgi:uncharacterized protein (TIGR02266 family)